MDCPCNCFGIAASSRRPVKRYNLLVPNVFPKQPPPFAEELDATTHRTLKKLFEYLEKNLNRGPKISRRLARRIGKDLPAGRLGYVQIAVAAYMCMMENLKDADAGLLFAEELVVRQVAKPVHFYHRLIPSTTACVSSGDSLSGTGSEASLDQATTSGQHDLSVVGKLLLHPDVRIQTLGALLLSCFTKQEGTADYMLHLGAYTNRLCQLVTLQSSEPGSRKMRLACLGAIREHIRASTRAPGLKLNLDPIAAALLQLLTSDGTDQDTADIPDIASDQARSVPQDVAGPSEAAPEAVQTLRSLAEDAFKDYSQYAKGPAQFRRFVGLLLSRIDDSGGWSSEGAPTASPVLALLRQACQDDQRKYVAYLSLLKHVSQPGLTPGQQLSVARTACLESRNLPRTLITTALVLAIKEFSPLVEERAEAREQLQLGLLECVRDMAAGLQSPQHLIEAVAGVASKVPAPSAVATAVLRTMHAASLALSSYPAPGGGERCTLSRLFLQEVGLILVQWEAPQQLLAHQVVQTLLGSGRVALRDDHVQQLLSSLWLQATQQAQPQILAALSRTLAVLLAATPDASLPQLARFAHGLQVEALYPSQKEKAPPILAAHSLAILALCNWLWGALGRRWGRDLQALCLPLGSVRHLRQGEDGLEVSDSSFATFTAEDQEDAAPRLDALKPLLDSDERQAAHMSIFSDVDEPAGEGEVTAGPSSERGPVFRPSPSTLTFPRARVDGSWFSSKPRPTVETEAEGLRAKQETVARVLAKLRESRRTTELENTRPGITSFDALVQATRVEARKLAEEPSKDHEGVGGQGEPSVRAANALSAVDRLLLASSEHKVPNERAAPEGSAPAASAPAASVDLQVPESTPDGVALSGSPSLSPMEGGVVGHTHEDSSSGVEPLGPSGAVEGVTGNGMVSGGKPVVGVVTNGVGPGMLSVEQIAAIPLKQGPVEEVVGEGTSASGQLPAASRGS